MTKTFTRTVDISYVLIFYVGFQGGRYYLENRIQELGFVVVLTLFAYGAIKLAMQRAMRNTVFDKNQLAFVLTQNHLQH